LKPPAKQICAVPPSNTKGRSSPENRRLSPPALPSHHFRARLPPHAEENRHPNLLISGTPRRCKVRTPRGDSNSDLRQQQRDGDGGDRDSGQGQRDGCAAILAGLECLAFLAFPDIEGGDRSSPPRSSPSISPSGSAPRPRARLAWSCSAAWGSAACRVWSVQPGQRLDRAQDMSSENAP
jgi:hypothetical protein